MFRASFSCKLSAGNLTVSRQVSVVIIAVALDYISSKVGSVTLVTLKGTIVAGDTSDLLKFKTQELLDAGERNIILDLAGIMFVDSTGIGALIDTVENTMHKGGSLKLLNVTKHIHNVIQLTRLSSAFGIYDDLEKAIASFAPETEEADAPAPIAGKTEEDIAKRKLLRVRLPEHEEETIERRDVRRWVIPVPVRVKGTRPDGSEFEEETTTTDVSPGGMSLLLTVAMPVGGQLYITAPEERFESPANVIEAKSLTPHLSRVRVRFPKEKTFSREAAEKKYVYDYSAQTWVAYLKEGIYYDSKHQPFGKIEDQEIISFDSGQVILRVRMDRIYDLRMSCIGHLI